MHAFRAAFDEDLGPERAHHDRIEPPFPGDQHRRGEAGLHQPPHRIARAAGKSLTRAEPRDALRQRAKRHGKGRHRAAVDADRVRSKRDSASL